MSKIGKNTVVSLLLASLIAGGGYILLNDSTKIVELPDNAVCAVFDVSDWTQEEKNLVEAAAYSFVYERGENNVPAHWDDEKGELCFKNFDGEIEAISGTAILRKVHKIIDEATPTQEEIDRLDRIEQCKLSCEEL